MLLKRVDVLHAGLVGKHLELPRSVKRRHLFGVLQRWRDALEMFRRWAIGDFENTIETNSRTGPLCFSRGRCGSVTKSWQQVSHNDHLHSLSSDPLLRHVGALEVVFARLRALRALGPTLLLPCFPLHLYRYSLKLHVDKKPRGFP